MQALAFAGSSFCTEQSPAHHRAYRDARSRDRERGLRKLSGVDVHVYTSRSDRLLFRLWRYGPARAHSGAPLYVKFISRWSPPLKYHQRKARCLIDVAVVGTATV